MAASQPPPGPASMNTAARRRPRRRTAVHEPDGAAGLLCPVLRRAEFRGGGEVAGEAGDQGDARWQGGQPGGGPGIPAVTASMWGEWKARATPSRLVLRPGRPSARRSPPPRPRPRRPRRCRAVEAAARAGTALRPRGDPASSSAEAWIVTIAPPAGAAASAWPRAATSPHARAGRTPRRRGRRRVRRRSGRPGSPGEAPGPSSRNSATSMANRAGWVYPVLSSAGLAGDQARSRGAGRRTPRRPRPGRGRTPGRSAQSAAHAGPLGALAREQLGGLAPSRAVPRTAGAVRRPAGRPVVSTARSGATSGRFERGRQPSGVTPGSPGGAAQVGAQPDGLLAQGGGGAGGQDPGQAAPRLSCAGRRGVVAAGSCAGACSRMRWALVPLIPKDGDAGPPRCAGLRPGDCAGEQGCIPPTSRLAGRAGRHGAFGHQPVPHRHDHLDDAGHPGGGLGVADVRLHRTDHRRPVALPAVGREQGLRLDRVAERGPVPWPPPCRPRRRTARRWPAPRG